MAMALIERARAFRREATSSEEILWEALRRRSLGVKFRRQWVIGPFVADFASLRPKLVVEVDGPVHEEQRERDLERQRWLEANGYPVLRVTSADVENDLTGVLARIGKALGPRTKD